MSDVMQVARSRCKELEDTIAKREEEIKSARAEIEKLREFLRFGEGLIGGSPKSASDPVSTSSASTDAAEGNGDQSSEKSVLSAVAAARAESDDAMPSQQAKSGRMPTRPITPIAANGAARG